MIGSQIRVLVLARLFAGLKACLAEKKWEPRGVPAVCRLLEGLSADPNVDLLTVFTAKEPDARFAKPVRGPIAPIGETLILPHRGPSGPGFRRLGVAVTEFEQTARVFALIARFRPHVIYATYANVLTAALLARTGHRNVVLRFMGIFPHHRAILAGGLPLLPWQLRSPFAHVVCTEDGSDPAVILPRLLRPETPWSVRLNGCDIEPMTETEIGAFRAEIGLGDRPIVAFVGRLEPYKGCVEFTDAALAALQRMPGCADFVIVGDGPLRGEMESRARAGQQSARMHFVGAQPHSRACRYVRAADIYVSTNLHGNLSNANLEALVAGTCLVLPTSDASVPLDTSTDRLIPHNVALRYDRNRLPDSLADALTSVLKSASEIAERRIRTAALARHIVKPWADCVASDIALLKSIAAAGRMTAVPATAN